MVGGGEGGGGGGGRGGGGVGTERRGQQSRWRWPSVSTRVAVTSALPIARRSSTHSPYLHIRSYTHRTRTPILKTTRRFKSVPTDARQTDFSFSYFFSFFSLTFSSRFPLRFRAFPSASRLTRSDIARFSPFVKGRFVYARASFGWPGKNQRKGRSEESEFHPDRSVGRSTSGARDGGRSRSKQHVRGFPRARRCKHRIR